MPPRRAPPKNRPPTLKEARRAYLKRGGSSYMPEEERQRLIRAQEREERRVEKVKKEASRQEAAKKRAESAAKQRDERRRLGLPDPKVRIGAGQLRIGEFLKGKIQGQTEEIQGLGEDLDEEMKEEGEARQLEAPVHDLEDQMLPDEGLLGEHHGDGDEEDFGSDVDDEALALGTAQRSLSPPPTTSDKRRPIVLTTDLRSSFFESNSQIDREVNETVSTSPIEQGFEADTPRGQRADATATPQAAPANRLPPPAIIKTPERSEIESILFAIPSQELDYLSSSPAPHPPARTTRRK